MKQILLFFILGYTNIVFCQSELKITPCLCDSGNEISLFEYDIELYQEGKLIATEFYPVNDFVVNGLKKGKYQLKYKSIFGQKYQKEIRLRRRNQKLKICIDDYTPIGNVSFIENLTYQDTLELKVYAMGCEYDDYGKIQITKKGNKFEGSLTKSNGKKINRQLSKRDIVLIRKLEDKIHLVQTQEAEGHTRTLHYEIRVNGVLKIKTMFYIEAIDYIQILDSIF